ncbi:MAG: hypothetical protein HY023_11160 [Chloroflexi bacterium]|nr:hypothetical protein [Chloroflexota bacterium]
MNHKADAGLFALLDALQTGPPDTRVIRLSLADNGLAVHNREQRTVAQAGDLLRLIQNS